MKKGLSPIVSAILILLIAIAVTLLAIIWLPKFINNIFPPIGTEFNNSYMRSRACLSIDNIDPVGKTITISNCGKISLSQFNFYIDGIKINLIAGRLDPQQSVKLNYLEDITQGEHNFYVTSDYSETPIITFYVPFLVFGAPQYFQNSINNTVVGKPTLFSLYWTSTIGLSGYIFQFCNGTWTGSSCAGSGWKNVTISGNLWQPITGFTNWSNVTVTVNSTIGATIAWCVYANDTNGNWNMSSCANPFSLVTTVSVNPFQIDFVNPTPSDGNVTNNNFVYVNVSIVNSLNTSSFIDWNRSLVGYWAMDWYNSTGIFDNSTWNNFGTFNGANFGQSNITNGQYGKGLRFDGVDDKVSVPYNSMFNSPKVTVSAWVNLHSTSGSWNAIVGRGTQSGGTQRFNWALWIDKSNSNVYWGIGLNNATPSIPTICQSSLYGLLLDNWYYLTGTYDNSTYQMNFYVNGTLISSTSCGYPIAYDTTPIGIAQQGNGYLNVTEDEVRIWNRVLSPEEINASYNSGINRLYHNFTNLSNGVYQYYAYAIDTAGNFNETETRSLTSSTSPPILWFKFNEANGTKTYDSSGNGFVGTFGGETFNNGFSYSASTPTDLHTASGYFSNALKFNGSNQYVNVTDSNLAITGSKTISLWINSKGPASNGTVGDWSPGGTGRRIVYKYIDANNGYQLSESWQQGGSFVWVVDDSGTTYYYSVNSTYGAAPDKWTHLGATYNSATHAMALYLNGTLYNNAGITGFGFSSASGLHIGYRINDGYFNGTMDEVRVWNRTLSQAEIQNDMQSSLPVSRPAASYSFEEPTGATYVNDTHIWVNGTYGSALSFDGVNNFVNVSDSSNLDVGSITITAWIYPLSFGLSNMGRIVEKTTSSSNSITSGYTFYVYNDSTNKEQLSFEYMNSTGTSNQSWSDTHTIKMNTWQHVAVTYDGKIVRFYVNGTLNGTTTSGAPGPIKINSNSLCIGYNCSAWSSTRAFNGTIDDVRIWNRSLSQAEIQAVMIDG